MECLLPVVQAEEQTGSGRYTTAQLIINVMATNEFPPVVRSSINDFTGYIYENSPRNTLVRNALGSTALRLLVEDPDQVSSIKYLYATKYCKI